MNKKYDIYKPDIGKINNNRKTYYSFLDNEIDIENHHDKEKIDPITFINELNNNGEYIFNKTVIIKTKDKLYDTQIAGKIGNRIITLDNNSINIDDIEDIYEK